MTLKDLLEKEAIVTAGVDSLLLYARQHLVGTPFLVPDHRQLRKWTGRRAMVDSVIFSQGRLYVLLKVYRLDGEGFLLDDRLRTYIPLRTLFEETS